MGTPITEAINDIREGRMIILVDDDDRENEGDFVFAAEKCTPELINWMMSYGRGLICQPMTQQTPSNSSCPSRCFTMRLTCKRPLLSPSMPQRASPQHFCFGPLYDGAQRLPRGPNSTGRPGHIFPEARAGGVLTRPGHTEASVDLAVLAGCSPQAVIARS